MVLLTSGGAAARPEAPGVYVDGSVSMVSRHTSRKPRRIRMGAEVLARAWEVASEIPSRAAWLAREVTSAR